jgi:NAD(P)-dependent dehydrogenase (short-subunit alcohol dehydrogenase family)
VVLGCRRLDAAERAAESIRLAHPHAAVSHVGVPLDLNSLSSVRAFAAAFEQSHGTLHLLVNNAGRNFWGERAFYSEQGVGGCAQINFLGCFALTSLLAGRLLGSAPSRVVTVSSVTHRSGTLGLGAARFLRDWSCGTYADAKLAQVLFAYELDRRVSARAVRSVVADPGAVQTGIWANTPLAKPAIKAVMDRLYAPPKEGAAAVLFACTADLAAEEAIAECGTPGSRRFREAGRLYFARGLFARGPITADGWLPGAIWKGAALLASVVDQPLRRATCGSAGGRVSAVRSSPESYDRLRARELWNAAADAAGLPQEV